jgi:hypothetical protein
VAPLGGSSASCWRVGGVHRGGLCGRPLYARRLGWQRTATAGQRGWRVRAPNGSVIRQPPPSFPLHCPSFRNTARVHWRRGPDRASQVPGQPSACVSQLFDSVPSSCLASRTTPSGRVAVDRAQMVPHSVSRSLVSLPSQRVDASLAPLPAQQLSARARLTSRLVANLCRFQRGSNEVSINSSTLITSSAGFVSRNPKVGRAAVDDVVKFLARYSCHADASPPSKER